MKVLRNEDTTKWMKDMVTMPNRPGFEKIDCPEQGDLLQFGDAASSLCLVIQVEIKSYDDIFVHTWNLSSGKLNDWFWGSRGHHNGWRKRVEY